MKVDTEIRDWTLLIVAMTGWYLCRSASGSPGIVTLR